MRQRPQRESFEHFYLTKVALGEGCGCAEHATRIRELEAYGEARTRSYLAFSFVPQLAGLLRTLFMRRRRDGAPAALEGPDPTAARLVSLPSDGI